MNNPRLLQISKSCLPYIAVFCGLSIGTALIFPIFSRAAAISKKKGKETSAADVRRKRVNQLVKTANALEDGGDIDSAIEKYKAALALNPARTDVCLEIARAYDSVGRPREAFSYYHKAFNPPPNVYGHISSPVDSVRFGELALGAGDLAVARKAFKSALGGATVFAGVGPDAEFDGRSSDLHTLEGIAYAAETVHVPFQLRLETARKAYQLAPSSVYVCCNYGWWLDTMRQYKDARRMFDRAIQMAAGSEKAQISNFVDNMGNLTPFITVGTSENRKRGTGAERIARPLVNFPFVIPHPSRVRKLRGAAITSQP